MDLIARDIGKPVCACLFVVGRGLGYSSTKRDFRCVRNHPGLLSKTPPAHLLCCVIGNNEICIHCFFRKLLRKARNTFLGGAKAQVSYSVWRTTEPETELGEAGPEEMCPGCTDWPDGAPELTAGPERSQEQEWRVYLLYWTGVISSKHS